VQYRISSSGLLERPGWDYATLDQLRNRPLEFVLEDWQLLILLLIDAMEMFCTNQIEGELRKDVLGKVMQSIAFI